MRVQVTEDELFPFFDVHDPAATAPATETVTVDMPDDFLRRWQAARDEFRSCQAVLHDLYWAAWVPTEHPPPAQRGVRRAVDRPPLPTTAASSPDSGAARNTPAPGRTSTGSR